MRHPQKFFKQSPRQISRVNLPLMIALSFLAGCAAPGPTSPSLSSNQVPNSPTNSTTSAPTGPLTVERAVERALVYSDRIATLKAAVEVARQSRRAATDIKDPVIQADSRSRADNGSVSQDEWDDSRVSVGFYIPNPWLVVPRVDARTADLRAAEADLRAATWVVRCDVRQLFAETDYLTNEVSLTEELVRLNGNILQVVRSRADHGAATSSELISATRQYLQTQDDLDQTRRRYRLAQRKLAALLNLPPESLRLAADTSISVALPESGLTADEAEKLARQRRDDLTALHWRVMAAESTYRESRNVRWPWVKEVKGGYLDHSTSEKWSIGLAMDVPIFSWTKNHADDEALAKQKLVAANETAGMRLVSQEIHDAMDELDESRRQQARYDTDVAPLITSMRQTLATLKNTASIMPDQIAAVEVQLLEALRLDLRCRSQSRLARLNLERIVGSPLFETVGHASTP